MNRHQSKSFRGKANVFAVVWILVAVFVAMSNVHGQTKGKSNPVRTFEQGPSIEDREALATWLANAQKQSLQIPVVVMFRADGLGIERAVIGAATDQDPENAIAIALDDGAMGIPLSERLTEHCNEAEKTCAVWLEGTWGALVAMPGMDETPTFAVRKVVSVVAAGEGAHIRVEVKPSE